MNAQFEDFGLYNVDTDYLRYLNSVDSEVQFSGEKDYTQKPFLGIIVTIEKYRYFIPLTSGKAKHTKMKNVGADYYLIYERINKDKLRKNDVYKLVSDTEAFKILASLEIKKMIPVKLGLYYGIDFASLSDRKYADLLEKEYRFCQRIQNGVLEKVKRIYGYQKETGRVHHKYCNFSKLESACDTYFK